MYYVLHSTIYKTIFENNLQIITYEKNIDCFIYHNFYFMWIY